MRAAAAVAFGLAFAAGGYLIWRGGWPVLALGLVSIASGVAYTAGRYALAYTGLADLFVLVFFGPVAVGGTYYVQALDLPTWVPVAGLGPGFLATAVLIANNVRDVEEDRAAAKRTLVVRFGRAFGVRLYSACVSGAVVVPAALAVVARDHVGVLAASAVAALAGRRLARTLAAEADPAALNPLLGKKRPGSFLFTRSRSRSAGRSRSWRAVCPRAGGGRLPSPAGRYTPRRSRVPSDAGSPASPIRTATRAWS